MYQERWAILHEVQSHAEEGCPYCAALVQGIVHLIPDIETRYGVDARFRFQNRTDMIVYVDPNGSLRGTSPEPDPVKLAYRWFNESSDQGEQQPYNPPGDTSSNDSFAHARWWIYECLTKHTLCNGGSTPDGTIPLLPLPTRVLDLGEPQDESIRLVETTPGQSGIYIALSHSWGGEKPLITTTANLESHKSGILLTHLPKTFLDAVEIARRLDVRYLWIDSLCILQDSPADWEAEASRMASVYRHAYLTVSATASSGPSTGIFKGNQAVIARPSPEEEDDDDDVLGVLFPDASKLRKELRLSLRIMTTHPTLQINSLSDPKQDQILPLLSRAWAYQERLLSPRVLHFGPQEVFWECMQDLDCECHELKWGETQGKHMGTYISSDKVGQLPPKVSHYAALHVGLGRRTRSNKVSEEQRTQKLLMRWEEMVQEYTNRALTFSSDRLPAFSGVAAEMVDALDGKMRYCAGQWAETFPVALLWERDEPTGVARLEIGETRPAPSWSWASVDAPVRFLVRLTGPYPEYRKPILYADVVQVECVPAGEDERGMVKLGGEESFVELACEMVRASLCFEPDQHAVPWRAWRFVDEAVAEGIKGPARVELTRRSFMVRVGEAPGFGKKDEREQVDLSALTLEGGEAQTSEAASPGQGKKKRKNKNNAWKKKRRDDDEVGGDDSQFGSGKEPVMYVPDVALCDENGEWLCKGGEEIWCAKILEAMETFYWLVLRRVGSSSGDEGRPTYERIGVVQSSGANWETSGGKQTILIV